MPTEPRRKGFYDHTASRILYFCSNSEGTDLRQLFASPIKKLDEPSSGTFGKVLGATVRVTRRSSHFHRWHSMAWNRAMLSRRSPPLKKYKVEVKVYPEAPHRIRMRFRLATLSSVALLAISVIGAVLPARDGSDIEGYRRCTKPLIRKEWFVQSTLRYPCRVADHLPGALCPEKRSILTYPPSTASPASQTLSLRRSSQVPYHCTIPSSPHIFFNSRTSIGR